MSYIVVDTEKSSGYLTASKEHATLGDALNHRRWWIEEMAADHGRSVAWADWASEGLWVFQVLPVGTEAVPPKELQCPEYEPMYLVRCAKGLFISDAETLTAHPPCDDPVLQPLVEVCNRLDGTIKFSYETPEPE